MVYNFPSNSQIFGQIAHEAGVEGILYPSSKRSNKNSLAIFPKNFNQSISYVQIEDRVPEQMLFRKLDATTYLNFI